MREKVTEKELCVSCHEYLVTLKSQEPESCPLIEVKNRGGLLKAITDVVKVIRVCDYILKKHFDSKLCLKNKDNFV